MKDAAFESLYSATLERIESAIEDSGADLDFETANDILTITCEDGSAIIITRQGATQQLWLAARSGGFHYHYDESLGDWLCTLDGRSLTEMLNEIFRDQGGLEEDLLA